MHKAGSAKTPNSKIYEAGRPGPGTEYSVQRMNLGDYLKVALDLAVMGIRSIPPRRTASHFYVAAPRRSTATDLQAWDHEVCPKGPCATRRGRLINSRSGRGSKPHVPSYAVAGGCLSSPRRTVASSDDIDRLLSLTRGLVSPTPSLRRWQRSGTTRSRSSGTRQQSPATGAPSRRAGGQRPHDAEIL